MSLKAGQTLATNLEGSKKRSFEPLDFVWRKKYKIYHWKDSVEKVPIASLHYYRL